MTRAAKAEASTPGARRRLRVGPRRRSRGRAAGARPGTSTPGAAAGRAAGGHQSSRAAGPHPASARRRARQRPLPAPRPAARPRPRSSGSPLLPTGCAPCAAAGRGRGATTRSSTDQNALALEAFAVLPSPERRGARCFPLPAASCPWCMLAPYAPAGLLQACRSGRHLHHRLRLPGRRPRRAAFDLLGDSA